jgi:hypothetical protein
VMFTYLRLSDVPGNWNRRFRSNSAVSGDFAFLRGVENAVKIPVLEQASILDLLSIALFYYRNQS